jgi:hypothetical protein
MPLIGKKGKVQMYKTEISKVKQHIQKGRWWLGEAENADVTNLDKVKQTLSSANYEIESASLGILELCKRADADLSGGFLDLASGFIEQMGNDWLRIRLNMPLPNTHNNRGIKTVSNTINNLLNGYTQCQGSLPQYTNTFVAIIEHRKRGGGGVLSTFDHDNKGFKAVPNALKGRVFGDDNQFEMSLGLFTRESADDIFTEIYVLPMSDLPTFAAKILTL